MLQVILLSVFAIIVLKIILLCKSRPRLKWAPEQNIPKNALACILWLAGAGLSLVKISAEPDHYYRSCGHNIIMCQGQVYPLS